MLKFLLGNPYALLGVAGAFLLLIVGNIVLYALWHGAVAERDAAIERADLAAQDATRWHAASDLRDGAITELTGKIQNQNDAISRLQFSLGKANAAAAAQKAISDADTAALNQRIEELQAEAEKRPADVREVGPIVRERVGRMWE